MIYVEHLRSIPHNEHHLNRYIKFVSHFKYRNNGNYEKHHICPKAKDMFPQLKSFKDHPWNLVLLTKREHLISHRMLLKAFGTQSTAYSFRMIKSMSGRPESGFKLSDDHKNKIAKKTQIWHDANRGALAGANNPRFGKPVSNETKSRISQANKGKKRTREFIEHMRYLMNTNNPASVRLSINGIEFPSIKAACNAFDCDRESMLNYAHNLHKPRTKKNASKRGILSVHFIESAG